MDAALTIFILYAVPTEVSIEFSRAWPRISKTLRIR